MTRIVREEDAWRTIDLMSRQIAQLQRLVQPREFITDKRLPENPYPDQEIIFQADEANSINWILRYNADSPSAYKWEWIGGSPMAAFESGSSGVISTAADLYNGPSMTVPLAGDFEFAWGGRGYNTNAATGNVVLILTRDGTGLLSVDSYQGQAGGVITTWAGNTMRLAQVNLATPGRAMAVWGQTNTGTGLAEGRWLTARPIRVG